MGKTLKSLYTLAIGCIIITPLILSVYLLLKFQEVISAFSSDTNNLTDDKIEFLLNLNKTAALILFVVFWYCIIHILRNEQLSSKEKLIWIIAMVLFAIITAPIYWIYQVFVYDKKNNSNESVEVTLKPSGDLSRVKEEN